MCTEATMRVLLHSVAETQTCRLALYFIPCLSCDWSWWHDDDDNDDGGGGGV